MSNSTDAVDSPFPLRANEVPADWNGRPSAFTSEADGAHCGYCNALAVPVQSDGRLIIQGLNITYTGEPGWLMTKRADGALVHRCEATR